MSFRAVIFTGKRLVVTLRFIATGKCLVDNVLIVAPGCKQYSQ